MFVFVCICVCVCVCVCVCGWVGDVCVCVCVQFLRVSIKYSRMSRFFFQVCASMGKKTAKKETLVASSFAEMRKGAKKLYPAARSTLPFQVSRGGEDEDIFCFLLFPQK